MKSFIKTTFLFLLFTITIYSGEKKVLVEVFTNSHCPLCPPAHQAVTNYSQTANGNKIVYVYYHMQFPYPSDQLYQHNTIDAQAKNNLYGPYTSTPQAFFDGEHVTNSYSSWATTLDGKVSQESNFDLMLTGNYSDNEFTINAEVTKTNETISNDLTINYVVVEDVIYQGNNGISDHKNVMRTIPNLNGTPIAVEVNETKNFSQTIVKNNEWNTNNLKVIVYIQSSSSKEVYQTELIDYNNFTVTGIKSENELPTEFTLEQNYPNPFNPSTTIKYSIPSTVKTQNSAAQHVLLKVYDILGKEVATLVNEQKTAGNYYINFNASELTSGIYFYKLNAGNFIKTKKMTILK